MQNLKGFMWKNEKRKISGERVFTMIKRRLPGGLFFGNIAKDISSKSGFGKLMFDVLVYAVGRNFSFFLFPKMKIRKTGEYSAGGFLYHITPVGNIDGIKQKGIVSKRNYAFLIDDVEWFLKNNEYLNWKSTKLKKNTEFRILKINASALQNRRSIYCTNREHEFVTKKVEPELIIFD